MEVVIFWIVAAVVVAVIAARRGRSTLGWFFLALIFSPLLMGILVLVLSNKANPANDPTPESHVKCPDCRELVLKDARKCKHCGCSLVPQA